MKTLVAFWKKDLVNKLIILTAAGLVVAVIGFSVLLLRMPADKSLKGAISAYAPAVPVYTPTGTGTATLTPYPEWTPNPTRTLTPTLLAMTTETPGASESPVGATPLPTATTTPSLMPTLSSSNPTAIACIPSAASQTARVLEIIDGATIKVLLDDKVYVVRYLGLEPLDPLNPFFFASTAKNSELVYARDIQLIADATEKDANGRLLRYVLEGDTLVNLEMLNQGLVGAASTPPDYACSALFSQAEQTARQNKVGQWSLPPTP